MLKTINKGWLIVPKGYSKSNKMQAKSSIGRQKINLKNPNWIQFPAKTPENIWILLLFYL